MLKNVSGTWLEIHTDTSVLYITLKSLKYGKALREDVLCYIYCFGHLSLSSLENKYQIICWFGDKTSREKKTRQQNKSCKHFLDSASCVKNILPCSHFLLSL